MGFTVNYRSTRPISPAEVASINQAADEACHGRTWLSCEPIAFLVDAEGYLDGSSKPNFHPHPDDVASAAREGLPDGTARDLLEVLCRLSQEHGIDWAISHDSSDGLIGFIREGVCDVDVQTQVEIFADVAEELGNLSDDEFFGRRRDDKSDDDAGPSILPFRPERD